VTARFDPLSACPYASWAELRREHPVHRVPGAGYFVVSRFDDVRAVAREPARFSSRIAPAAGAEVRRRPPAAGVVSRLVRDVATGGAERPAVLATADPPDHTRQRRIATRALAALAAPALETRVRRIADALLDRVAAERHVEWMSRVAMRLPLTVTADLLGLPGEDLPRLERWTGHAVASVSGSRTTAEILRHARAWDELERYVASRLAASGGDGVLATIARATDGSPGSLSIAEAVAVVIQLLVGGNESTSSLLGSALLLLATDPPLQERLRADPATIPTFVEEALRLESPFRGHFRVAAGDAEIAGVPIPAGARVMLLWGAANRDERAFERPDEVDLARPRPRDHLAFGEGIHYCLGAALARLQTRVALEALLARVGRVRLAPGPPPAYLRSLVIRRLAALPLDLDG
jgi:cytochrome P450